MARSDHWAVVYFANSSDQVMTDAAGPFRSKAAAEAALAKLTEVLHSGACLQLVGLAPLAQIVSEFSAPEDQRYDPDDDFDEWRRV